MPVPEEPPMCEGIAAPLRPCERPAPETQAVSSAEACGASAPQPSQAAGFPTAQRSKTATGTEQPGPAGAAKGEDSPC